jgi:type I restriction enzyme S subunit
MRIPQGDGSPSASLERDPEQIRSDDAASPPPSRARRLVNNGDTILSTVRTYLRAIGFISNSSENLVVSTGFAVLSPKSNIYPKFLWRLVQSNQFIDSVVAHSEGVGYPAINSSTLAALTTWIPPLEEQKNIASFLDKQAVKLDALIAKKERLIELLHEKRTAIINHAILHGLNPDVEVKDSRIPSIGFIPSHWNTSRNKMIFNEIIDKSETGDEELLTVSHITGVTPRKEKEVYMFMAESLVGYKKCMVNDLIINTMWAWMGALGISKNDGLVSPSYNVYRLNEKSMKIFNTQYLDYLYRTPQYISELKRNSKGVWSSRERLYPESFFEIMTIAPPISEQDQIVGYIYKNTKDIQMLINKLDQSIDLLKEYRAALISAAVTGKIDVRGEA